MHNDFRSGGSNRANRALDAANFFLADVRDGLGPYLAIYLLTVQKWDEAGIGIVMSIAAASIPRGRSILVPTDVTKPDDVDAKAAAPARRAARDSVGLGALPRRPPGRPLGR